jgi:polyisoprenoid-binding protein YceI
VFILKNKNKQNYLTMKKMFIAFIALLAAGAMAFTGAEEIYTVDTEDSYINWRARKVTGTHNGKVMLKSGTLTFDNGELAGGNFEIDMPTITVEDLTGNGKAKLEGHLKSPDFFSVEKHPVAKFVITDVEAKNPPEGSPYYRVSGDLTIKGITNPISFNANVQDEGSKMMASANITVDRSKYDVRYGSESFFGALGDKAIYDNFDLYVNLVVPK